MARTRNEDSPSPHGGEVDGVRRQMEALGNKMQRQGVTSDDLRQMNMLYDSYLQARTVEPPGGPLSSLRRWLFGE